MQNSKCKICRRVGERLFLKGEKCLSPKCPFLRKPYPPGQGPKKTRKKRLSEYGKELREAQKIKNIYRLREKQFKKIVREVFKERGGEDVSNLLIKKLEKQLSNVIFRAGLAKSRNQSKELISHGHFLLNGKMVNISSIEVKMGDEIKLKEKSKKSRFFEQILLTIKKENIPSWLSIDKNIIKVVGEPKIEEAGIKVDVPLILAFYSR